MGVVLGIWFFGGRVLVFSSPGVISVRVREERGVHTDCTTHTSTVDTPSIFLLRQQHLAYARIPRVM